MGKYAISAASSKMKSTVTAMDVSPHQCEINQSQTVGLTVSPQSAIELARQLLAVALDATVSGPIIITGHKNGSTISILRRKK